MALGGTSSCVVLKDGSLYCWGYNENGELGIGTAKTVGDGPGEMGSFLKATDIGTGLRASAIALGAFHMCVLSNSGGVACWGTKDDGRLGISTTATAVGTDPSQMGNGLQWVDLGPGRLAIGVSCGTAHTCAILSDGTVGCWGSNAYGQLGIGSTTSVGGNDGDLGSNMVLVKLPVGTNVTVIVAGGQHNCALTNFGQIYCWGRNTEGQLGIGTANNVGTSPSDIITPVKLGGGGVRAAAIGAGNLHTCAMTQTDQNIVCWGSNDQSQLGINPSYGTIGTQAGDLDDITYLKIIDPETSKAMNAAALSVGSSHTCALTMRSSVYCWGSNQYYQLGLGTNVAMSNNPALMDLGGRLVYSMACGANHNCAQLMDRSILCWGFNPYGQLGYGNTDPIGKTLNWGLTLPSVDLGIGDCPDNAALTQTSVCSCNNGFWEDSLTTTMCTSCPVGTYGTAPGATSSAVCAVCTRGTYSLTGASFCSNCDLGTFETGTGLSTCAKCYFGLFASDEGE